VEEVRFAGGGAVEGTVEGGAGVEEEEGTAVEVRETAEEEDVAPPGSTTEKGQYLPQLS
jgi:hypothetical protein